ncbi:MAG: hypothetical protein HYX63_01390 [Gammaproteobacteria bacterium]|nr:hypothetical protein [Gammaproteobacteria bacterium]
MSEPNKHALEIESLRQELEEAKNQSAIEQFEHKQWADKMIAKLDSAESRAARLQQAIEEAPHANNCSSSLPHLYRELSGHCNCWKHYALKE